MGATSQATIKMLLIGVFSVTFTFFFFNIIFHQRPLVLLPRRILRRSQGCPIVCLRCIYFVPIRPAPELPPAAPAGPSAQPRGLEAPRLPRSGGELHQIALVPGHLVLLQALVVCARLVSSGNRRSLKCQRGGLTNSAGINFNECMFLRKTAKLKKKFKPSCLGFLSAAVHNG